MGLPFHVDRLSRNAVGLIVVIVREEWELKR
jgi:hypothetical protein